MEEEHEIVANSKLREKLYQIIKEEEDYIQSVTGNDKAALQKVYILGEKHILELVKLALKESEEEE